VADIVEEIVRIEGLDTVPSVALPRVEGVARPTATPEQKLERSVRRAAAARGLDEAITWSFLSEADAAAFGGAAWTLANPISADMKAMRPSLLPGLVAAARRNRARGQQSIRLFEIGRRYLKEGERPTLGLLLVGDRGARDWRRGKATGFDALDAKAEVVALLAAAGAPADRLQVMEATGSIWHPGRSASLRLGPKTILAELGELHPSLLKTLDLEGPAVAAEIYLDAIPGKRDAGRARAPYAPAALQAVRRDFAFLVPAGLASDALTRAIAGADKQAIVEVSLFDTFTGAGVPEGQISLGIEVVLQPGDKSFAEADLKAIADKVVAAAAKLGAVLRG
jgi:phenylalanyl-tRNA synthetase beta chain